MVNYTCYRCGYTVGHKAKIKIHLSRKTLCKPLLNDINLDECKEYILQGIPFDKFHQNNTKNVELHKITHNNTLFCEYCKKIYSRKDSLTRHLKNCNEKKKDDTVKKSMSDLVNLLNEKENILQKELDKKNRQIDELIKKAGIQNSTITQNIQNNIKLLSYGKTDTSHLTDQDYLGCLQHKNFCIPYLIEKIHFDKNKPENHNIYISNLKNKYIMMYEKRKWKTKNRNEAIDKLISDKEELIENKLYEWEENGNDVKNVKYRFDIYIEKKNIKNVIDQIKDDIELMLYNNKDLIKK